MPAYRKPPVANAAGGVFVFRRPVFVLAAYAYLPAAVDTLEQLRDYVTARFARGRSEPLSPDDDLLRMGVLDSMAIMEIVGFLEMTYGVSVEGEEVTVDNFRSLAAMTRLIERKRG